MALQKTRKLKNSNIDIVDSYCRIDAFRFDNPDRAYVKIGVYENEAAATPTEILDPDGNPTGQFTNTVPVDTIDLNLSVTTLGGKANLNMGKLYTELKKLDEFTGATDV